MSTTLIPGISYSGKIADVYCEKRGTNNWPCITLVVDVFHGWDGGAWIGAPSQPDGTPNREYLRWGLDDKSWKYTEKKLKTVEFNGDFKSPKCEAGSIIIVGEQKGEHINFDLPYEGAKREAIAAKDIDVYTARYKQNNPASAPAADSAPPPPPASTSPEPGPEDHESPPDDFVDNGGGGEDIPF